VEREQYEGSVLAEKAVPVVRMQPSEGWVPLRLGDLWEFRELLYFLTWRDLKVRYKQTILGAGWAILQPLIAMVIFTLFFGRLAQIPSDGVPYPIFSFAALLPWTFFDSGVGRASTSLVAGSNMLKKVYFPRLVMPLSAVSAGFLDFLLAFVVLLGMMLYFQISPTVNVLWLPALLLLAFVTALGVSLWLAAMSVQFRDIQYIQPFIVQAWLFATPVAYPASLIENVHWRTLYAVNPMVGVVEGFRWALLGTETAPGPVILVSAVVAAALLIGGAFYFRRMERTFADVA
jgi:lipopolysaccharide transport system permease protein